MFGQKAVIAEQKETISEQSTEISTLGRRVKNLEFDLTFAKNEQKNAEVALSDEKARVKNKLLEQKRELEEEFYQKNKEVRGKFLALQQSEAVTKKENEILNKAFAEMGFDVKDMKSILDKLVEGVVSKNTINVVK